MYLKQALDAERQMEAVQAQLTLQHDSAKEQMLTALRNGVDLPMPSAYGAGHRAYKVSTHLGECAGPALAMLFETCAAASQEGADPIAVLAQLRAYVDQVAEDYAADLVACAPDLSELG